MASPAQGWPHVLAGGKEWEDQPVSQTPTAGTPSSPHWPQSGCRPPGGVQTPQGSVGKAAYLKLLLLQKARDPQASPS